MPKAKCITLKEAKEVLKSEGILPLLEDFRKSAGYKQTVSSAYKELMAELADILTKVTENEYTQKMYEEDVYYNIILRLAALSKVPDIPKVSINKEAEQPLFNIITKFSTEGMNKTIVEKTILKMLMSVDMIIML